MRTEQLISVHRGASESPPNRFEKIRLERNADRNPDEDILWCTPFLVNLSQTAFAYGQQAALIALTIYRPKFLKTIYSSY
jgi:hypothetical protein